MTQQYKLATFRHLETGKKLAASTDFDDAGYHFGMSGENCVKAALELAGLDPLLAGLAHNNNPMRAHFPKFRGLVSSASTLISANLSGRMASPISNAVLDPAFQNRFEGWSILIRYADTTACPVLSAKAAEWQKDAEDLIVNLLV